MTDLESEYAEISSIEALNERRSQLQQALDEQTELRERQWERYRRFMATVEEWIRPISPALFYIFVADGPSLSVDHPLLNGQIETLPRAYHDRDEAFQQEMDRRRDRKVELVEALRKTDRRIERLRDHLEAVAAVRDRRLLSGEELSEGEAEEGTPPDPRQEKPPQKDEEPITGYYGPEYAEEAVKVLDDNTITSFTDLNGEMGESRVDTVKRNIGYDDLPREEKGFSRFKSMLKAKVKQLEGEDEE